MSIGLAFWIVFLLGIFFGFEYPFTGGYRPIGRSLTILILIFLLGWKTFGFILQG